MPNRNNPTALVTGASSGIGRELAIVHAQKGGDLVLVARRKNLLDELKEEIKKRFKVKVTVIRQDLAVPDSARELYQKVEEAKIRVDILINNAGFGKAGFFSKSDLKLDEEMIHLNVVTLTALTRLFMEPMIERKTGRILNVASVAGFVPGPLQAVYFASKAYVVSFGESVANELQGTGVTLTTLCPGQTTSEFATRAGATKIRAHKFPAASARNVAEYGYRSMLEGRCIAVHGVQNKILVHFLLRLLPRRVVTDLCRRGLEEI
ncbi:MAG: SDR family oxidoreductase [Candidatus Omnitrophica bacterium]|nr:SDR family oxidoreductase [Candidatus Omnitrophota bacterium]